MQKKILAKLKKLNPAQRIGVAVLLAIILALLIVKLIPPERSVEAYCRAYGQEKTKLAKLSGSTYSSGIFDGRTNDASEFADSFGRLEKVAPTDISPDVATLKTIYQSMHDNPSQAIVASLSGVSAENSVKQWTSEHCSSPSR